MKQAEQIGLLVLAAALSAMMLGFTAFASPAASAVDAGGLTKSEALNMPLEAQFNLVRDRNARMGELLTEAQEQISTGEWSWLSKGLIPDRGPNIWSVGGMDSSNSYSLEMGRSIHPEGATGMVEDLDPMIAYFASKGWPHETVERSVSRRVVTADTGEGYWVEWRVQDNGQYNMTVMSGTFWGDGNLLLREVGDRLSDEAVSIESSIPGVFVDFPKWEDPKDYAPDLLSHRKKNRDDDSDE